MKRTKAGTTAELTVEKKFQLLLEISEKISTTLEAYSACQAECAVNPHSLPGDLTSATTYTWFVKAKGYTGETAKSEVRTFVTP